MALVAINRCICPPSDDVVICSKCGGMVLQYTDVLAKVAPSMRQWLIQLDNESTLEPTLATYMAIDRQMRQGVPIASAVKLATQQIGLDLTDLRGQIERDVSEAMSSLRDANQDSVRQMRSVLEAQIETMVTEVKTLVEQGKSVKEVEARVKEVTLALQNYLTAIKLPGVKGEVGEINVIQDLQDAFLGQSSITVDPIGGSDATDILIKFLHEGNIEIGRCLVEIKSRKIWSNDYLEQVREDMNRYNAPFAVLVVDRLPKNAKGKNFHIDITKGLIITTPAELVVPTVTMFYEIHANSYKLQNKTLSLESLASDRDLLYYIDDNMKILEDCKKIADQADDSAKKIKTHATNIASRLQQNNRALAQILSKFSITTPIDKIRI